MADLTPLELELQEVEAQIEAARKEKMEAYMLKQQAEEQAKKDAEAAKSQKQKDAELAAIIAEKKAELARIQEHQF
jgi:uncharacterized protein (DUF2225 family)